jgi:hypothetical protein
VNAAVTHLPRNVSFGTERFCVGFTDDKSTCNNLPLNLSDLLPSQVHDLPDLVQDAIQDQLNDLQPYLTALTNVVYIRIGLILGLVSMLLFASFFVGSMLRQFIGHQYRTLVYITLAVICCQPLLVATVILAAIRLKSNSWRPRIEVQHGEVGALCFGAFGCAIGLIIISRITSVLVH